MIAGGVDLVEAIGLLFGPPRAFLALCPLAGIPAQQVNQSQHRIHRRADFMTHIGQKSALGLAGRLGLLLGRRQIGRSLGHFPLQRFIGVPQRLFGQFALRDTGDRRNHADYLAPTVMQGRRPVRQPAGFAIQTLVRHFDRIRRQTGKGAFQRGQRRTASQKREQHLHLMTQDLSRRFGGQANHVAVPDLDPKVGAIDDNALPCTGNHLLTELVRLAQGLFQGPPLGNVLKSTTQRNDGTFPVTVLPWFAHRMSMRLHPAPLPPGSADLKFERIGPPRAQGFFDGLMNLLARFPCIKFDRRGHGRHKA